MRSILFFMMVIMAGCTSNRSINEIALKNLRGKKSRIDPSKNALTVIYFLSPECPLCINYTLAIRQVSEKFADESVAFYGVHSGKWFSASEVGEYMLKYSLEINMLLDPTNQLAQTLGATVTPEVFVLNSKSEILYFGKIDNWINDLGKKKLEVSARFLEDALADYLTGTEINPKETKAVGCLIE
ncbi:redoxin domain-containing protein [Flavobacteriales bacterium]|nr:redoxin domain-containing protein [Flavobacteriales bacterium]